MGVILCEFGYTRESEGEREGDRYKQADTTKESEGLRERERQHTKVEDSMDTHKTDRSNKPHSIYPNKGKIGIICSKNRPVLSALIQAAAFI